MQRKSYITAGKSMREKNYCFDKVLSLSTCIPPLSPSNLETGLAATHSLNELPPILWQARPNYL